MRKRLTSALFVLAVAALLATGYPVSAVVVAVFFILLLSSRRVQCWSYGHRPGVPFSDGGGRFDYCTRCRRTRPHVAPKPPALHRITQLEIDGNVGCAVKSLAYNHYVANALLGIANAEAEKQEPVWPVGQVIETPERIYRMAGGMR